MDKTRTRRRHIFFRNTRGKTVQADAKTTTLNKTAAAAWSPETLQYVGTGPSCVAFYMRYAFTFPAQKKQITENRTINDVSTLPQTYCRKTVDYKESSYVCTATAKRFPSLSATSHQRTAAQHLTACESEFTIMLTVLYNEQREEKTG